MHNVHVKVGEIEFDGMKDFVICSSDVYEVNEYAKKTDIFQVVCMRDASNSNILASKFELKIVIKKESLYLIQKPFDYEFSNGVFMKLYPHEEYPLQMGSVI